jgi:hypothetical protein
MNAGDEPNRTAPVAGGDLVTHSTAGLREVSFPSRGLSATELLLAINLAVAAILLLAPCRGHDHLQGTCLWPSCGETPNSTPRGIVAPARDSNPEPTFAFP